MQPLWALGRASAHTTMFPRQASPWVQRCHHKEYGGCNSIWRLTNEAYHAMQEKLDGQLWVKYREDGWSRVTKHLRPIVVT